MEKKKKEDKYYLPRDISWMYFNRRILQEAMKERVPILERLSFLGKRMTKKAKNSRFGLLF